jgi:hypothetical protein
MGQRIEKVTNGTTNEEGNEWDNELGIQRMGHRGAKSLWWAKPDHSLLSQFVVVFSIRCRVLGAKQILQRPNVLEEV